jgi:hypothetical protein
MCRYLNKVKLYIENYIGIGIGIEIDKDKIEFIWENYMMVCIPEMNKILYDDFMYYLNLNPTRYQMWPIYIYKYEHIYVGINNVKIIICDIINNKIVEKRCDGHIFKTYIYVIPNKKGTIEIIYEYNENGELYSKIINIKHKKIEYNYDYKNNRIEIVYIFKFIINDYYQKSILYNYENNMIIKTIEGEICKDINMKDIKTSNNKLIYI